MSRFMVAALLFTTCLLQVSQCDRLINIESLFPDVPSLGERTSIRKSLLPDISFILSGKKENLSADQQKDIFNAFSGEVPFEVITGELKPTVKEITSTEFVEQPENGYQISHANNQPLKLSDIFGLKSVIDNLHDRIASSEVTQEDDGGDGIDKKDEENAATDNDRPNIFNDISIIVVNEQQTTQRPPPPPPRPPKSTPSIVTIDTEVIATKTNYENCPRKKDCNLFNIKGLLSKFINLSPYQAKTTKRPTTAQQARINESSLFPFLNFDNLLLESLRGMAAPVVKESTDVPKTKNSFAGCGKNNDNSHRSCGLSMLNITGLLSKIINDEPLDNTPQKDTAAHKMDLLDSQRFPLQNFPVQVIKAFPAFSFQEYPPTVSKISPQVHKHRKDNASNGQTWHPIIEMSLNALSNVSPERQESHNEQKKEDDKSNIFVSSSFDNIQSVLENFNLIK